tara:strand:- start:644 stop:1492 length:849 start_codon:yes stop_codon:yes gene_type:complete
MFISKLNNKFYEETGILLSQITNLKNLRLAWQNYYGKNILILRTIPRSGSHFFMNIFANYIALNFFEQKKSLEYIDIKDKFWNGYHPYHILFNQKKILQTTGFINFVFVHVLHDLRNKRFNYSNKKFGGMINLYRNPFDNYVSVLNFQKKNVKKINLSEYLESYCLAYLSIKDLEKKNNVINIPYEDLYRYPFQTMIKVLTFFNISRSNDILEKAINSSDIKKIKLEEKNHNNKSFYSSSLSSHVNSGKIGQWKNFLSNKDINFIEKHINKHGILLDEFILE